MPIEGARRPKWPRPATDTVANWGAIELQRTPLFGRENELINYLLKTMDRHAQVPLLRDMRRGGGEWGEGNGGSITAWGSSGEGASGGGVQQEQEQELYCRRPFTGYLTQDY